jgi:hypothetical protein
MPVPSRKTWDGTAITKLSFLVGFGLVKVALFWAGRRLIHQLDKKQCYFPPVTARLFVTENTFGTPLA